MLNICTLVAIITNFKYISIMVNKILNLEGVTKLTTKQQKEIKGNGGDLIACRCTDGSLVVGHAENCQLLIEQFCSSDI